LRDPFIFAPAFGKRRQIMKRILIIELGQKIDKVMHARVRLLRARFQQIKKLFVVSEKSSNGEHKTFPR
jgi:hypothetical protein